uniref:AIG1-type G domain-containing protein n=1 Tax=Oreochromis aureus TaxID=47969 RepID=A0A668V6B2_OREAU
MIFYVMDGNSSTHKKEDFLKIVLLGGRDSGKNAVGNLILGKEEFGTKERTLCSSRIGEVAGLRLTVVNAPGWWCDSSAQSTPKLVKREIITSVALCSPGPHVFLIIIKATPVFSEKRRRALEEHMALLGDTVWSHCMVVFTCAEKYKDKNPEEYVERWGKALRWLSEKCSQRCHSVVPSDNSERTVLLAKIQKLVTENGNSVFEMQENFLRVNQEEKREMEERTRLRCHVTILQNSKPQEAEV